MAIISVLSTPSRPQYLASTLEALDAAGANLCSIKTVFLDGPLPRGQPLPRWGTLAQWAGPIGARRAMWWVFRRALDWKADRLIYCEDDILPAPRAVERILATEIRPEQALISFFDSKEFPGAARAQPGIHDVPIMGQDRRGLFGACCLLIPRRTLEFLAGFDPEAPGVPEGADQALSWVLRDSPWPVRGVSIPSLVEHIGDISSMGHAAGQRAALFSRE